MNTDSNPSNRGSSGQSQANVTQPPAPAETNPMDRSYVPPRDEVAKRAYYIFLNQGGYNGADLDHWLEAELQLFAEHNAALKERQAKAASE